MKSVVHEIAPDLFRLSTYLRQADLQFNQFLVRDEEPMLFHTGLRTLFPLVKEAVAQIMDPAEIRWVGFSHFEADECGCLNEWLAAAPQASPVCGMIAATVNINDFSDRRARVLADGEVLATGRCRFRFLETPQVPHGWDAGLLFEEEGSTLFCSDLFLHNGNVEPVFAGNLLGRTRDALAAYEAGPLRGGFPFTSLTVPTLSRIADLRPQRLALMHGSSYTGDGRAALLGLSELFQSSGE
jgi:glyoxylase-like metal-dependent hydrolase (beta-lactamase superfamily II)